MQKVFLSLLAVLLPSSLSANPIPLDFDSDSITDLAAVQPEDGQLRWRFRSNDGSVSDMGTFGRLGEHLAPGNYSGQGIVPATITSEGEWKIQGTANVNLGSSNSLFLAGSDFDGDGLTDQAITTNVCEAGKSVFRVRLSSSGSDNLSEFGANRGNSFKFYMNSDGNGGDEACTLIPLKRKRGLTGSFRAICRDMAGNRVSRFRAGRINEQPLPLKISGSPDALVIPISKARNTRIKVINSSGRRIANQQLDAAGIVVVGNFTSSANQQVAVVNEETREALVFDPVSGETVTRAFPRGVAFDQVNIVHFKDSSDCFCTTSDIRRGSNCRSEQSGNNAPEAPSAPEETPSTGLYVPNNCSNPPKNLSFNDGFRCIASATRGGSIVCLLPHQFTWTPHKSVTDHHGYTFACNRNDTAFDSVDLVLKSGQSIPLVYAGCHNYVATESGWIGRQHFRNEGIQWDSVKRRVDRIIMRKGSRQTCLRF